MSPNIQDNGMDELLFKDEVYKIVGAAMEVHRYLGPGFLEAVYQEALAREFSLREIPHSEFPRIQIEYKEYILKKEYVPDYLCYKDIIVEIKAMSNCGPNEEAQIINALKTSKKPVGVFFNFGEASLYWQRYANTRYIDSRK